MLRIASVIALLAVAGFAPLAQAQRHGGGGAHSLPLSPGVMQGSAIGPGTQFLPQPTPRFVPNHHSGGGTTQYVRPGVANLGYFGQGASFNRYGFGYGNGYSYGAGIYGGYGYGGYGYGYDDDSPPPIFLTPRSFAPNIALANEFPATLTVQLPEGDKPKEVVYTSPVLKPGEQHTFAVSVQWTSGGKTFEAKRSVTLGPGDRSRLLIVSGEEVKK